MTLIKQAKQKYPPGTIFSNVNLGYTCENVEVTGTEFENRVDEIIIETGSAIPLFSSYTVYCKKLNKWATVTNLKEKIYELW